MVRKVGLYMAKLFVNPNVVKGHINPELQGHFSEHLGRCIYEGIYVGENSEIPNVNGMRTDVVEALKEIQVPVLRWPGDALQMNTIGRMVLVQRKPERK